MPPSVPFILVNAFSSDPAGGNPAAVVFLPEAFDTFTSNFPEGILQSIAKNFNQPITSFLAPLPTATNPLQNQNANGGEVGEADYAIRWFTADREIPLCGHGALAAARAILSKPDLAATLKGRSAKIDEQVDVLRFRTVTEEVVSAFRLSDSPNNSAEHIQLTLSEALTVPISPTSELGVKIISALSRAFQKPVEDLDVVYMGHGQGVFDFHLLVEVGLGDGLDGKQMVTDAFVCFRCLFFGSPADIRRYEKKGTGYMINVITSPSTKPDETFISRMFAPLAGVSEGIVIALQLAGCPPKNFPS